MHPHHEDIIDRAMAHAAASGERARKSELRLRFILAAFSGHCARTFSPSPAEVIESADAMLDAYLAVPPTYPSDPLPTIPTIQPVTTQVATPSFTVNKGKRK